VIQRLLKLAKSIWRTLRGVNQGEVREFVRDGVHPWFAHTAAQFLTSRAKSLRRPR
jgi:hypothetical protein